MPARIEFAAEIEFVEIVGPLEPAVDRRERDAGEVVEEIVVVAVEPVQQAEEARPVLGQPRIDGFDPLVDAEARTARGPDPLEDQRTDASKGPAGLVGLVELRHRGLLASPLSAPFSTTDGFSFGIVIRSRKL